LLSGRRSSPWKKALSGEETQSRLLV
jgi:hypothetical protein